MISSPTKLAFSITQLFGYAVMFLWAMICSRVELAARLLAAESQLTECKRRIIQKQAPKPSAHDWLDSNKISYIDSLSSNTEVIIVFSCLINGYYIACNKSYNGGD